MEQCFLFILQKAIVFFIRLYQPINPFKGTCRFIPTCSEYAAQAVQKHGTIKGLRLSVGRILKCHAPNGGIDEVK